MGSFLRYFGSFRQVVERMSQTNNKFPSLAKNFSLSLVHNQQEVPNEEMEEQTTSKTTPRINVSPETSIRYMNSQAYKKAYGEKPVWELYRRNFKGQYAPPTRKTCIRKGQISTGNPCPICRDEYLLLHHENTKLLEQFISPHSGEVLSSLKTGICQKQHKKLLVEIAIARNYGYLEETIPLRIFTENDWK